MTSTITTPEDRSNLASYEQALAAAPDDPNPPRKTRQDGSLGDVIHGTYLARNETTGHGIHCADLLIAHGYVAASRVVFPNEVFALRVGDVRVDLVEHHPDMLKRLEDPRWGAQEADIAATALEYADSQMAFDAESDPDQYQRYL